MLSILAKVVVALVVVTSGVAAGSAATGTMGHLIQGNATSGNLTAAEQAAIAYVDQHYPGNGTAQVLKVENDTENGTAVVDVTVLAPNGHTYDVEVNHATDSIMSVEAAQSGDHSGDQTGDDGQGNDQSSKDSGSSGSDN